MEGKIKVVVKHPGCLAAPCEIDNTLEAFQELVEGYIEAVTVATNLVIICNEEGAIRNLPFNCEMLGHRFFGTLVFCGVDDDRFNFTDIPLTFDEFKRVFGGKA